MSTVNAPASAPQPIPTKERTAVEATLNFIAGNPVRLLLSCVVLFWIPILIHILWG